MRRPFIRSSMLARFEKVQHAGLAFNLIAKNAFCHAKRGSDGSDFSSFRDAVGVRRDHPVPHSDPPRRQIECPFLIPKRADEAQKNTQKKHIQ
jgi:hypothetical protein